MTSPAPEGSGGANISPRKSDQKVLARRPDAITVVPVMFSTRIVFDLTDKSVLHFPPILSLRRTTRLAPPAPGTEHSHRALAAGATVTTMMIAAMPANMMPNTSAEMTYPG